MFPDHWKSVPAAEAALKSGGPEWRAEIGNWINTSIVPAEILVPEEYRHWRPLVGDAMSFVFAHLSESRLAAKIVEQVQLPVQTPPELRLLVLISRMPGLQKVGQVVARNRRLSPALRKSLSALENGMSDMDSAEVRAIVEAELGPLLQRHYVEIAPDIFREGSASAVIRFTWFDPASAERRRGVFKVLKPYVPEYFAEDLTLIAKLGKFLAANEGGYPFAIHDVQELLAEVRQLLEHELDFTREQATLIEASRAYRSNFGIAVPRLIAPLCTARVTAMTEADGVKVTDACRRSPVRRRRIAEQVVEALLAVPLFSRDDPSVFHADPHAGNLLYNEPDRELQVIDWALAEHMRLEDRRQLALLALMMNLRNRDGVFEAICALAVRKGRRAPRERLITRMVDGFFDRLPPETAPGTLDAMRLLDDIALEGVHFPPSLFMFRKIVFTLDGVLHDIAGEEVHIDTVITREFLTRWIASFGWFHAPLATSDVARAILSAGSRLVPTPSWPWMGA
jgi:ubiquinone biosynthesis protein